jgi:hypothetical protein
VKRFAGNRHLSTKTHFGLKKFANKNLRRNEMKKLTVLTAAVALCCFLITADAFAQKPAKGDTVVTTTIHDADANFTPYRIQSDLLGTYKNGVNAVESIIQGLGDYELDLINFGSSRRARMDFSDPVPNTNPNNLPPPVNGFYAVRLFSQCSARGLKLQTLALGASINCPLIVAVNDSNGDTYSVRFNRVTYAGTNDVSWTCVSAASGKCNGWRMQSDPTGNGARLIAQLLKITRVGNKTTEVNYGRYYFTFDVSLTNP